MSGAGSSCAAPAGGHCVVSLLEARAAEAGERPYFTCEGETISFAGLWKRAGEAALRLQEQGVSPGDLVAGLSFNSVDYLVLQHGCLRLGAVLAALNPSLQKDDLQQTLARIQPKVLIAAQDMDDLVRSAAPATLPVLPMSTCVAGAVRGSPPAYRWKAAEWCWVVFSGATTGLPKGIMLPHNFYMAHADRTIRALRLTGDDRFFSNLQMCHAWLNFVVLGSCLKVGAHCEATRWFSASRWLDQVHAFDATIVDPFLPMASALVAQPPSPRDRTHRVRASPGPWGTMSEWDRRMAFEERFGITTINCFGITEAGGLIAAESVDEPRTPRTNGKPTGDFEIAIADEDGNLLPRGQQGEILYRPTRPAVMSLGYLRDAERTLATWRDLWIHSADLGYIDEEGNVCFVGRMPHWLRRKGENVSARDVELAIRDVPGVADAAVLGVPSNLGDDDIKAVVVLSSGADVKPAQIHAWLTERISFFKVPRYVDIVDDFPRTIKAEPDRKRLHAEHGLHGGEWDAQAQVRTARAPGAHSP